MFARLFIFIVFCVWFIMVTYGLFDIVMRVKKIEEDINWLIDEHDRHNNYIHSLEVQLEKLIEKESINEI